MPIETYNHTADITQIESIEFCVFGNPEVKRYSVINDPLGITIAEAFENGEPKQGGLIDKRLGVTDYNMICDTCGCTTNECPGHFGHVELAEEVFHFLYLDIAKNIANCICLHCSKSLVSKNKEEVIEILGNSHKKIRFAKFKKHTANVKFCQNCGKPVGKISKEISKSGNIQLMVTYMVDAKQEECCEQQVQSIGGAKKKKNIEPISPNRLYSIFKNIDDNDCRLMGFDPTKNRPESFIIKYFPIPPVAIRPSVRLEMLSSGPSEDGLTSKLADIVKDNGRLRKQKDKTLVTGEESKYNQDYLQLLQYDIATYFDNESVLPKSEQKGSKASKSVSERLKGKGGRIRGNLMGKRVDFSARTVITSDPNLSLDELGVPIKIAMNITFPEEVTPFNIDRLSKLVRNGRDVYPGANFVLPFHSLELGKKSKIDLRYRKKSVKLHYGDIVERHIVDGDPVLFNRQPSLHKMSMMCHRIRVIKDESLNTFRLNVTTTTPYNADFDGDEMNMFIPQCVQTQLEIANIADVQRQIISPRYSKPIIKFKQDTVLGTFKMTEAIKKMSYNDAMNLAMYCKNVDMFKIGKEEIDTHKLYSLIIPNLINFSDGGVNITNGKLLTGTMGDNILNQRIVYYSWDRHGSDITKDFYDNAQRLVTNWLLINGFSVGLGDATTNQAVIDDIKSFCEIKQMEVDKLITEMENNPDTLDAETFESNILSTLKASDGEITKRTYDHLRKNEPHNNFYVMVESKAKGSQGNIGQIIGGLGQNVLEFRRIKKKVNNRTLPHFFQNDDRAFARGFIPNSYYHGLTPKEFFFHHMTAREGMIDTAIKSVTGDTPIIILDNGITKHVKIGDWIDQLLESAVANNNNQIQLDNDGGEHREMLQLPVDFNTYIPTTDLDGNVKWGQITHITRHNPSAIMYEIKTSGGRNVIVTDSHSLLIWNENTKQLERKSASNVTVGNFVPVTAQLSQPPVLATHIDLTKYFPKSEYIYGTDFNKAKNMAETILETQSIMPIGWWEANNGTEFKLPYTKIQTFRRVLERSNIGGIRNNCIYSYRKRSYANIPEKFEFTEDNGLFLGLYIAEGNSDIPSGYVQITNIDDTILTFCKKWFRKHNIEWNISTKINKIDGTSKCIRGYSVLLATIMHKIAGHGARNKFISPECFNAPEPFIKQLINGIFSGDGTVTHNSVQIGSSSNRLIHDINMCLSRLGIFGKVTITRMQSNNLGTKNMADINMLSIRANWAQTFKEKISLILKEKNDKLKLLSPSETHRNFSQHNDIVLDTIIEINQVDSSLYPKVYDLTVPSTLNFGLANGLHVVDTADSGYLQRKLIKGMEDVMIAYDKTVRSGNNVVMQYIYGDNNINQTYYKEVDLKLVTMSNTDIGKTFGFTPDELTNIATEFKLNKTELTKWSKEIVEYMKELRDDLRNIQMKSRMNYITMLDKYQLPVNMSRIVEDAKNALTTAKKERLSPLYVTNAIKYILKPEVTKISLLPKNYSINSIKYKDQDLSKYLFKIALLEYLSPKRCIVEYKLTKPQFDVMIVEIIKSFRKACVEPGEMVGVLTAQSLGETLTQMTLNTFHSSGVGVKGMQGIPRFREILSYSKKIQTPYMIIKMIPSVRGDQNIAHKIEAYLKHTIMGNLVDRMDIIFDPIPQALLESDNINSKNIYYVNGSNAGVENLPWLYRFIISREAMLENDITLLDIKTKFIKYWDDYVNDSTSNKKKIILSKITNGCIMSNFDNSENPFVHIRFDIANPDNSTLVEIGQFICNKISIKGVETIEKVDRVDKQKVIEYDDDKGIKPNANEWVIYTTGIDLDKIKTIKQIDFDSVYLNDIYATYLNFGIEAARNLILRETDILYNGSGNPLNVTHLALLADVMTNTGNITSIDRHGINRLDTDPLSRASFEKTVEQLIMAAAFNEVDRMRSVSSRIMVGRCIKGGTGTCSVMLDNDLIENSEQSNQSKSYISSSTTVLEENNLMKDTVVKEDIDIFMP